MEAENENAFDFKIPNLLQRNQCPGATVLGGARAPDIVTDSE